MGEKAVLGWARVYGEEITDAGNKNGRKTNKENFDLLTCLAREC